MTAPAPNGARTTGLRVRLTGLLMGRQFLLLLVVATMLLGQFFFFSLYGQVTWADLSAPQIAIREWIMLPAVIVAVYGAVLLVGLAFAAGPSERSFHVFLVLMLLGFAIANYDQTIIDWILWRLTPVSVSLVNPNPVSATKVVLACAMFAAVILMHYNILADDVTRRLLGRGLAADEVLPVRGHMIRLLLPVLLTAGAMTVALALVGEFSQLFFRFQGLLPKFGVLLLGVFGVAIAVLLLNILRTMRTKRGETNG